MRPLAILFIFAACVLYAATDPDLRLSIFTTNLPSAVAQPSSGLWSPHANSVFLSSNVVEGSFVVFCGPTIAVTFPTKPNLLYECQASDDAKTWLGSPLRIVGYGGPATVYDTTNHTHRLYRVVETPQIIP